MPVLSVLGSFIKKPGNTILKVPHLSTKRNIGTTRAIAKAKPNNTWNGPTNPYLSANLGGS
jgi:hypothetical protein